MKIYALCNQKGGSGKTTSTVSLGAVLARRGHQILLVDLDPQASMSKWVGDAGDEMRRLLLGELSPADAVRATKYDRLDYVPASRRLSEVEDVSVGKLLTGLEKLLAAARRHYDYVLIDPPPSTGALVSLSLMSSDGVIAPVQAGKGAVDGLTDTLQVIRLVGGARLLGAFACRVTHTINDQQVPELLKEHLDSRAFDTYIRETVKVREAETASVPPPYYDAGATAAEDYERLTEEVLRHG